jgi:single-stranded DNA-binding protein
MCVIPVELIGKYAEDAAGALSAGDEVLIGGKVEYRSETDKQGQKTGRLLISIWAVTRQAGKPAEGLAEREVDVPF